MQQQVFQPQPQMYGNAGQNGMQRATSAASGVRIMLMGRLPLDGRCMCKLDLDINNQLLCMGGRLLLSLRHLLRLHKRRLLFCFMVRICLHYKEVINDVMLVPFLVKALYRLLPLRSTRNLISKLGCHCCDSYAGGWLVEWASAR